jgi:hypothetical protein
VSTFETMKHEEITKHRDNIAREDRLNLEAETEKKVLSLENKNNKIELISNLDKIHTTKLGEKRIRENLNLDTDNVIDWCIQKIQHANSDIFRKGKNWYISIDNCKITINANSYTIITAQKLIAEKRHKPPKQ